MAFCVLINVKRLSVVNGNYKFEVPTLDESMSFNADPRMENFLAF